MTCNIRKWRLDDAKDLAHALNNKNILNNLRDGLPYPYTEADATDFIGAMLSADENSTYAFAIDVDGKAIGSIGAFRQDNIHSKSAEIGYYIAEECWGKGIMTQAVNAVCEYLFNNTDIIRVYAEPFKRNVASCKVLEKCGFVLEGVLRSHAVKNGVVEDMCLYSKLRPNIR